MLDLTDAQCEGHACITCGKAGAPRPNDPEWIGQVDGTPVWACLGGCRFLATLGSAPDPNP